MSLHKFFSRCRRWVHGRNTAQQFAEFSLAIAVISITGIAGLSVLGGAEERYFIPLKEELGKKVEGGSDRVPHGTAVTMTCGPSTITVLDTIYCKDIYVRDLDRPGESPPTDGTVQLFVVIGGTERPVRRCTLGYVTPYDQALSRCPDNSLWYQFPSPGTYEIFARFVPSGTHRPSDQRPRITISVQPSLQLVANCVNPWFSGATAEVGHPLTCTVVVNDNSTRQPYALPIDVTWTPTPGSGYSYLYCSRASDPAAFSSSACSSPTINNSRTCLAKPALGSKCGIEFRRGYDDNINASIGREDLRVSAAPTGDPTQNSATVSITIELARSKHPVHVITSCVGASTIDVPAQPPGRRDPTNRAVVPTATQMDAYAGRTVDCTTTVFDADPSWAIDTQGCYRPADPRYCDPDASDAHAPLGLVKWVWHDATTNPPAAIPGQSGRCTSPGLGRFGSRPAGVFLPAGGQPDYASWCSASFVVPPGAVQIAAEYHGEGIVGAPHEGSELAPIFSRWIDVSWR